MLCWQNLLRCFDRKHWKLNLLSSTGLPILHGYGRLKTDSAAYIPTWQRELPFPGAKSTVFYQGGGSHTNPYKTDTEPEQTSTDHPHVLPDRTIATQTAPPKDWAADLDLDERKELLSRCDDTKNRQPGSPFFASCSAVKLLRACLPRPSAAHLGASPRRLKIAGDAMPRCEGNSTGSAVEAAATALEIDSIPMEDIASISSVERTPGLDDPPCARPSILTEAARSAFLFATAARRAALFLPKPPRNRAARAPPGV